MQGVPNSNARGFVRAMADTRIPTVFDLMPPTLVAVRNMGGSATKSELLEKVPDFAGVNDEQLPVVFPEDSSRQGKSKVFDRIRWARSQAPWPAEERRAFNIISDPVSDHHLGDPCASSPPQSARFRHPGTGLRSGFVAWNVPAAQKDQGLQSVSPSCKVTFMSESGFPRKREPVAVVNPNRPGHCWPARREDR